MATCLLAGLMGWRWLLHYNAYLKVECNSTDCFLRFASIGRYKKLKLEIPRHQLKDVRAVKVSPYGQVKEDNVNLNEEWRNVQKMKTGNGKKTSKKNSAINSFKGPDANGNFLTYAITFKDKSDFRKKEGDDDQVQAERLSDLEGNEKDLSAILGPFGHRLDNGDIRVVFRQNGLTQTHRRVRNMHSKLDSYIKKRRQKLNVRETAPASWQAILLVVFGLVGFLLTLLIGLFWDENDIYNSSKKEGGPGVRRRHHHSDVKKEDNPYGRQTPSRYEVSTRPSMRARGSGTTSRRR